MSQPVICWAVFKNPFDFPDGYVARRFEGTQPTMEYCANKDLLTVREWIQGNAAKYNQGAPYRFDRHPNDEPQVLEVWM